MFNNHQEVTDLHERLRLLRIEFFKNKEHLCRIADAGYHWVYAADDLTDLEWLIKSIEARLYGRSFSSLYFTNDKQPVDALCEYEDMVARGRYGRQDWNKRTARMLAFYLGFTEKQAWKRIADREEQLRIEAVPF